MKNKAKVHRLPTELMSGTDGLCDDKGMLSWRKPIYATYNSVFHHLYITTDEEIKEGDWYITDDLKLLQCNKVLLNLVYADGDYGRNPNGVRKIIATTDPKLFVKIKEYKDLEGTLPQIPQSFIEEYCKAGGIDEVLVEVNEIRFPLKERMGVKEYEFVPKLNPDNTIIIHPVEEKMYSREEVKLLVTMALQWNGRLTVEFIDKWIEENL